MLKKKKDSNQPVTIGDFQEFTKFAIENFATKKNLENFATKKELQSVELRLDNKIEKVEKRLENKITESQNKVMDGIDAVMREVKTWREEDAAHKVNHRDITSDIQDHGRRIKQLETQAGSS